MDRWGGEKASHPPRIHRGNPAYQVAVAGAEEGMAETKQGE